MPRSHSARWIAFLICGALSVFGCTSEPDGPQGETGALSLNLELGDTDINEVHWTISHPGMEDMEGDINTSAPGATASVEVFGLPPGGLYTVTLRAIATDGETVCVGSEMFAIEIGEVTEKMVYLRCKGPERFGSVRVNGEFNLCAYLYKMVVSPLETSVGNDIDLSAIGVDDDEVGDPISYEWEADGGIIDDETADETTYTCLDVGIHEITVTVTDDGEPCEDSWTVPVECVLGEIECEDAGDCDDDGNQCTFNTCDEGMCNTNNVDEGESCDQDGGTMCDGEGSCVECTMNADCGENEVCEENTCVAAAECEDAGDCDDDGNQCTFNTCDEGMCNTNNVDEGESCDQDDGTMCDGEGSCVECTMNADCDTGKICNDNECVSDPDIFCDEGLCAADTELKEQCKTAFFVCLAGEEPEETCIALSLVICNECNENSDCDAGEVCNDNKVCEPIGEIALPMVVDDHYFGRSGFSNGQGGEPLHDEGNDCPERAGEENGLCHRFSWDGMDGDFTGTFWTDGEGFDNLNGLPVEAGATEVSFYAWGAAGGEVITFGAGIIDEQWDGAEARSLITLTTAPTLYTVSLAALAGYTDVYGPFIWAADTTGNPSGFEFYVDDIQWVKGDGGPGCSDVIDFEDGCGPYVFTDFGGGVATVIDNPDSSGINTTAKVAQMQKFAGEVFGGSTLALGSAVDWTKGSAFTMKVWASRQVPVLFKLEGLNQERSDTQTGSSSWEELCYDFAGSTDGAPATAITFIFDLGTVGDAEGNPNDWTFYFDEIVQTDSCGGGGGGELTVNGDFETGALNIDDDAANGWTLAICDAADSCKATMDEANGGVWSGNLVVQGGIGDAVIKNANIGIGTVTPNGPVTVSVDVKGTTADGGVVFIEFFSELSGGGVSKAEFVGGGGLQATDTWTTYTLDTTMGPDVGGGVTLQLKTACGAATTCVADVFFDNASVIVP